MFDTTNVKKLITLFIAQIPISYICTKYIADPVLLFTAGSCFIIVFFAIWDLIDLFNLTKKGD